MLDAKAIPSGHTSVMANKRPRVSEGQPWQDYELFPTPPWGTRSFVLHVLPFVESGDLRTMEAAEPCAGLGHMSETLRESFGSVLASDIYDYGFDPRIEIFDFLDGDLDPVDWIITNPPFEQAQAILLRALAYSRRGVALLLRLPWLETVGRYDGIFNSAFAPTLIAPFVERLPMCEGGYDPKLSSATPYAWFVWAKDEADAIRRLFDRPPFIPTLLIPPGRKRALWRPSDALLATRFVAGWVPPSTLKKTGKKQLHLEDK